MKKIYQNSEFDCYPCCLSMLLKINKESIPIFPIKNYMKEKTDWFKSQNISSIVIPMNLKKIPTIYADYCFCIGHLRMKHKRFGHAVILKLERFNENDYLNWKVSIWHDPLGNKSPYTIKDLKFFEFIIPKQWLTFE